MTFSINADSDRDSIEDSLGGTVDRAAIRTSDARASRLQANVRRQARNWDVTVDIDEEFPTAAVRDDGTSEPSVVITGREIPQPITDYDDDAWDWIVQRGFGVHEVGHIRYTAMNHWQALMETRFGKNNGTAHSLHNALEDGAIERQITKRWPNYFEVLRALRANIFAETTPGIEDPQRGGYVFPVSHAIHSACLDLWTRSVYGLNIGYVDGLLDDSDDELHFATPEDRVLFEDEALPLVEDVVPKVLTTPAPKVRNEIIAEFVEEVLELLEDADADGKSQKNGEDGQGDDNSGMPDDSRESDAGEAGAMAEELGDVDADDLEQIDADEAGDMDAAEAVAQAIAEASDEDADDLEEIGDIEIDPDLEDRAADEAADDAREESGVTEDMMDELEEMAEALGDGSDDGLRSKEIQIPTDEVEVDHDRAERAAADADSLAQILRQRLQSERRTKTQRNRRRGRLDSSSMHRAARGDRDVKMQRNEPDEKDYHCVVVLDRSGSMAGDPVEGAEVANGMLLEALEQVGVETMLIELFDYTVRLAKPFGVDTSTRRERVYNGLATGGTPLADVMEIAKSRLDREKASNKFMVVMTDGQPSDEDRFEQTIANSTFPVIGVSITDADDPSGAGYYDRDVIVNADEDKMRSALEDLLLEVMF